MTQYSGKGNHLYYEPLCGTWFKSSPLAVLGAAYNFNRGLATGTSLGNLKYLYDYLYLLPPRESENIGWNHEYLAWDWNSLWVDFIPVPKITEDGLPYIEIDYPMEPKPMDYYDGRFY